MPSSGAAEPVSDTSRLSEGSRLDSYLSKTVPVWFVAALILFFAFAIVAFSWYVKRSVYLLDGSSMARAAIAVASFPTDVKETFKDIGLALSGKEKYRYVRALAGTHDFSRLSPVRSHLKTAIEGLVFRKGSGTPERGWRVIAGAFRIGGSVEDAAVMLSPDLEVVHYWLLGEGGPTNADPEPPSAGLTNGFTILRDGSMIFNSESAGALRRLDSCGRLVWSMEGRYHHSVTADDTETTVWSLREDHAGDLADGNKIVQIAVADGKVLREFSIAEIIAANPGIDILELRRQHENKPYENYRSQPGRWLSDPFHLNDVDPLPRNLAHRFSMFSAGDLAISAREINLIFVLDPATLVIKWWNVGDAIRQHDPDWAADGELSVFNNRMARDYSEIIEIDPATSGKRVIVHGNDIDFYSRAGGRHQPLPGGNNLIASPRQGRIIEVAPNGEIALEFYSLLTEEPLPGILMEAMFLPEQAFDAATLQCGAAAAATNRTRSGSGAHLSTRHAVEPASRELSGRGER